MVADEINCTGMPDPELTAAASDDGLTDEDRRLLKKYERTFIGTFAHTLDTKGRLVIPQVFRDELGDSFCIAPSYDFQSIDIYPKLNWARMREDAERRASRKIKLRRYLEQLDAFSFRDQECDAQGRVLLPTKIRAAILGNEKEVEITGNSDHIRVVTREKGEEQFRQFMADLPSLLDEFDDDDD